ncbi:MAG TPA: DUF721 domain-containing protein [Verrucomicrobiae bacterium]
MSPLGPTRPTPRERVCAQWRGVDLAPLEKVREPSAKPAGALLSKVLSELRIDRRQAEAEILKVWNQSLAPDIVAHAQPTGLKKSTLFVSVDSSAWLCEILRYRRREILDRLRHSFGRDYITKVSFRVG